MKQLDGTGMKRLHREWRRRTEGRLAVVLDDVQGPFNVGAIIRTAAALRAEHLWLAGRTPEPGDTKVAKTALGTERYLDVRRAETAVEAIAAATGRGVPGGRHRAGRRRRPAARARRSVPATCLVVGHEDRGVTAATLAACDAVAFLPLLGRVGSLNVATAASIACYEVRRRAWTAGTGTPEADGRRRGR